VLIDGVVVGGAPHQVCARVAEELRLLKGKKSSGGGGGSKMVDEKEEDGEDDFLVEPTTEIAWVPPAEKGTVGAYPGLYLFTKAARMIRPVVNLKNKKIEMIGPLEQVYLEVYLYKRERERIYSVKSREKRHKIVCIYTRRRHSKKVAILFPSQYNKIINNHNNNNNCKTKVACTEADIRTKQQDAEHPSTHIEIDPTNMLSLIAALTPFSDYNQGPRIMYQCQMGKQTMGTPAHSIDQHPENKAYKIQNPQVTWV
jgi:hypothetical protein